MNNKLKTIDAKQVTMKYDKIVKEIRDKGKVGRGFNDFFNRQVDRSAYFYNNYLKRNNGLPDREPSKELKGFFERNFERRIHTKDNIWTYNESLPGFANEMLTRITESTYIYPKIKFDKATFSSTRILNFENDSRTEERDSAELFSAIKRFSSFYFFYHKHYEDIKNEKEIISCFCDILSIDGNVNTIKQDEWQTKQIKLEKYSFKLSICKNSTKRPFQLNNEEKQRLGDPLDYLTTELALWVKLYNAENKLEKEFGVPFSLWSIR